MTLNYSCAVHASCAVCHNARRAARDFQSLDALARFWPAQCDKSDPNDCSWRAREIQAKDLFNRMATSMRPSASHANWPKAVPPLSGQLRESRTDHKSAQCTAARGLTMKPRLFDDCSSGPAMAATGTRRSVRRAFARSTLSDETAGQCLMAGAPGSCTAGSGATSGFSGRASGLRSSAISST